MTTRLAVQSDAEKIADVHVRSWQEAYRGLLPESLLANLSIERRAAGWHRNLADSGAHTFVSVDIDGRITGFASLGVCRDADATSDTAELTAIYVDPRDWEGGYGRALVEAVLEATRNERYRRLTLWVLKSNRRGRHFYEKMGFTADGTEKTETWSEDVVLEEVRYHILILSP